MAEHTTATDAQATKSDGGLPLTAGGVVAVALSLLVSLGGALTLPAQVRVHYTLGLGPYYGPETLARPVVLVLFPALVAGLALFGRLLADRLTGHPEFEAARLVYDAALLGSLGVVLVVQAVLFAAGA